MTFLAASFTLPNISFCHFNPPKEIFSYTYPKIFKFSNENICHTRLKKKTNNFLTKQKNSYTYPKIISFSNEKYFTPV